MLRRRIIPTLLIRDKGLVKTSNFRNPVYVGDPINAIKIYNEKEVDELVIFDIDASRNGKGIDWNMLKRINREAFMPLGYGGGIKSLEDIKRIIGLGYEKVILNSVVFSNPGLVEEASKVIGSQSLVACIDIKKTKNGSHRVFEYLHNKITDIDPFSQIAKVESLGAGEAILHSVDREGTYMGYDLEIISEIARKARIPIVALGGASSLKDIAAVLKTDVSAAAAGSIFVFFGRLRAVLINYPDPGEIDKLML